MSVWVAIADGTRAVMASDSRGTNGQFLELPQKFVRLKSRSFVRLDILVSSPDFAIDDILTAWPLLEGGGPLYEWARDEFVPTLREKLATRGLLVDGDERRRGQKLLPSSVLIAGRGSVVEVQSDGGIVRPVRNWETDGSGRCEASGALVTFLEAGTDIAAAAAASVRAACKLDQHCGEPIHVDEVGP